MKTARLACLAILMAAAIVPALAVDAVSWDSSGNGLLNGTYNFREVMWRDKTDLHRVAIYGTIVFDGSGGYRLTSSVFDSAVGFVQSFSVPDGAYRISASGMGFMDDPIRRNLAEKPPVWGTVSQGVFIGSTTDDGINNLFIAALAPSSAPTNASFNGSYRAVAANFPSGNASEARDMFFPLNPNGQGSLGTVNLTGYIGASGATISQTVSNAVYSGASGALTLGFGGSGTLISGNALCYLTSDGNFFFGGSPNGFDMIVGVRPFAGSAPPDALNGLYYQAGADVTPSKGFGTLATYYGAFSAGSGTIVGHQRILTSLDTSTNFAPFDYTYSDTFSIAPDGTHNDFLAFHHVVGAAGALRIGYGIGAHLGINVALRAPDFTGSGTYLSPAGVANAASSAPFTAGVSRNGFIALYGSGLSSTTLQDDRLSYNLGGVQVLVNGRLASIYFVRSDVVLAIVPFATTESIASIQVINNGVASAVRTVRVKDGTPGIYTNPPGGVSRAIAQHIRGNTAPLVTPQDPARPGETITLWVAGLGDVNPPVSDGVAPPIDPLSRAVHQPVMLVHGEEAKILFAGLAPGFPGVYIINLTIPSDVAPGDVYVDISLPDSYTSEAQIPIGAGNVGNQQPRATPATQIPGTLRRFPLQPHPLDTRR
ncbi:MAG TPA: hypothetical protein VLN48_01130 [Bryobacteraceae bacterium]|nr:hypothetical protein [Bryobacteraceae bacterium]